MSTCDLSVFDKFLPLFQTDWHHLSGFRLVRLLWEYFRGFNWAACRSPIGQLSLTVIRLKRCLLWTHRDVYVCLRNFVIGTHGEALRLHESLWFRLLVSWGKSAAKRLVGSRLILFIFRLVAICRLCQRPIVLFWSLRCALLLFELHLLSYFTLGTKYICLIF